MAVLGSNCSSPALSASTAESAGLGDETHFSEHLAQHLVAALALIERHIELILGDQAHVDELIAQTHLRLPACRRAGIILGVVFLLRRGLRRDLRLGQFSGSRRIRPC